MSDVVYVPPTEIKTHKNAANKPSVKSPRAQRQSCVQPFAAGHIEASKAQIDGAMDVMCATVTAKRTHAPRTPVDYFQKGASRSIAGIDLSPLMASSLCASDEVLHPLVTDLSNLTFPTTNEKIIFTTPPQSGQLLTKAITRLIDIAEEQQKELASLKGSAPFGLESNQATASFDHPVFVSLMLALCAGKDVDALGHMFAAVLRKEPALAEQIKRYIGQQIQKVIPFISHSADLKLNSEAHAATSSLKKLESAVQKLHRVHGVTSKASADRIGGLIDAVVTATVEAMNAQRQLFDAVFASSNRLEKEVAILETTKRARTTADAGKSAMLARLLQLKGEGKILPFTTGRGRAAVDPEKWIEENLKPLVSQAEEQYLYVLDVYRHFDKQLYDVLANRRRANYAGSRKTRIISEYQGGRRSTKNMPATLQVA